MLSTQQIRFCTSRDGTRIAYGISGEGPPLIWSPHWVHHLKLDWDSPIWRSWLAVLTRRHTLVRYDWRGCGLSDRDNITFSFEKNVEDLTAVIEAAGFKRFAILGNGNGGANGIAYAARHPEHVTHLVLNGGCVCGRLVRAKTTEQREEAQTRLKVCAATIKMRRQRFSSRKSIAGVRSLFRRVSRAGEQSTKMR